MSTQTEADTKSYTRIMQRTRVPSGKCPIEFSLFWDLPCQPPDTVVCAWFLEVRAYGVRRGEFFTGEAIAYWARDKYDSDEIEEIILGYNTLIGE